MPAARRFASGSALAYTFSVIAALACPRLLETVLTSMPWASANVAHVWRKSWKDKRRPSVPRVPSIFVKDAQSLDSLSGW